MFIIVKRALKSQKEETVEISQINTSSNLNNTTLVAATSSSSVLDSSITLENSSTLSVAVPVVINHRQRFATLNCINGRNGSNNVEEGTNNNNQFNINRQQQEEYNQRRRRDLLCRTPPPNYHSLPNTPPPCYTPNPQHQQHQHQLQQQFPIPDFDGEQSPENPRDDNVYNDNEQQAQPQSHSQCHNQHQQPLRPCQVPETLALPTHEGQRAALSRLNVERQTINESVIVNRRHETAALANGGRCATRNVATVSQQQQPHYNQKRQQEIQQRRRKQRRRNLYILQQQQQQLQQQQHNNLNLNSHTIDSESSTSLTDTSESDNDTIYIGNTRDQRRRRRQRLLRLRDAYCPDLLNACSLILLQQQQTSDSTVGSFTDTPPPPPAEHLNDSTDYVEIDEVHQSSLRRNGEENKSQSLSQIYEQIYPQQRAAAATAATYNNNRLNGGGQEAAATSAVRDEREEDEERDDEGKKAEENQRLYYNNKQEMGQNLSIRRPRISLTWVLREQSQNQQQQQQQQQDQQNEKQQQNTKKEEFLKAEKKEQLTDLNNVLNNNKIVTNTHSVTTEKKKYRLKHIPGHSEPLNGYATTPTGYTNTPTALGTQKFFSNQNLLEYHSNDGNGKPASKDLLFVCTPQRAPDSFGGSTMDVLALAKKRNEIRKKLANKMAQFRNETQTPRLVNNVSNEVQLKKDNKSSLKSGSYSEPSLIAASEGNSRRHRHRKRRERNRSQKFGYEIKNVDEFLNKCSLASPGNIPMVLSTSCILYQTRPGGYQTEISLPLGMVVNAVFKNQNWLYVQTPHAEEGYVNYNTCLPLGILPPEARKDTTNHTKPTPCWESNGDIFPKPCGNMTDSEKEIHLRVGSRSEGARTPHLKIATTDTTDTATIISVKTENTDCLNGNATASVSSNIYGEQQVDKLYLRAASQPKLNEKTSYAQLKIIRNHSSAKSQASSVASHNNDEYVTLQQHHQQQQQHQQQIKQKHVHANQPIQKTYITRTFITNGHNGQHLHPKDMQINLQLQHQQQQQQLSNCNLNSISMPTTTSTATTITVTSYPANKLQHQQQYLQTQTQSQQQQQQHQSQSLPQHQQQLHHQQQQKQQQQHTFVAPRSVLNAIRRSTAHCGQRQTLVAITTDYTTDALTLHKGDIVTLCECRETKDHRQWFYVRTRDGRQGYIPAEVAGHGYL
ncbi:hypothetical protein DOY81_004532 [Sarcophaga bullata]|nr:hypothetical protein DOY81_004532 [Sarcophaga bullata]